MLTLLLRWRIAAFERRYGCDMSYARAVLAADARAVLALAQLTAFSSYRRGVPAEVYYAAQLVGTMAEDCGPCTQLVIGMALRDGVGSSTLVALVSGDDAGLGAPVRLAVAFARAVLARDASADSSRDELRALYGERGVVSLCFAISSARLYPTLKYALGHGARCQRLVIGGREIAVSAHAA